MIDNASYKEYFVKINRIDTSLTKSYETIEDHTLIKIPLDYLFKS